MRKECEDVLGTGEIYLAGERVAPGNYKQIEWQEPHTEALHKDISYPDLPKAAAYICTGNSCSSPVFKPEELAARIDRISSKTKQP